MRGPLSRRVYTRSYGAYVFRRHIPTWRTGRVQSAGAVTSAQPSGSSWRPSRVAARLYCSNKSYHPAITAPITPPRDEYILVLTLPLVSSFSPLSLSFSFDHAFLVAFVAAAVSCSIYMMRLIRAIILKSLLVLSFFFSRPPFPSFIFSRPSGNERDTLSLSFFCLSVRTSSRCSCDTRPDLFSRSRVTADHSHILGRGISKLGIRWEYQPAGPILLLT